MSFRKSKEKESDFPYRQMTYECLNLQGRARLEKLLSRRIDKHSVIDSMHNSHLLSGVLYYNDWELAKLGPI